MLGVPNTVMANDAIEIIDNDFENITISVSESTLHVAGANGMVLDIYNLAGVRVLSFKVEGADKHTTS